MKKNKRLLSLCLGLVLVLGLSACDDLTDILGDLGSGDSDLTTDLEEEDGDDNNKGNDDTSESNISYTYSVLITNADELTPLVVEGDTVTAKVELVTTTHHIVGGKEESSSVEATAEDVTLESSTPGVLEIDGLTINPIGAGTTTLTAYWEEHEATSSGVDITVSEPDSYTYELTINNKDSYTSLTTESTLDDVSITLTTYKNGVVEGTPETGSGETVSLVSTDPSVISVTQDSLSLTVVGAGDTIITAYWIGHEDEANDTIAITISEPTSGGDTGGENPGGGDQGGEEPGGGSGDTGDTGGQGGDEGGGSGEGGGTGGGTGGEEPGGDEPETVYISTLTFDKETYTLDMTTDTTATFTVTTNEDASNPNAYTVKSENESVATVSGNTITAVGVGETKIIAESTDNPGSPIYGYATVTVSKGYTVVESFSLSQESITLEVGESASIGYAGEEGTSPTVTVTYSPSDARNSAFTLTGATDDYLTIGTRGENNTYTITASDTPEDAGSELKTYTLTLSSDDEESDASTSLSVTINDIEAKSHPVTDLTLSDNEKVIAHDGSFTIGPADSGADITASVNEGAYDSSINVTASDDGYLTVSGPDEKGVYTVTANVSDDNSVTSSVTVGTANASISATISVTIERAEAYANEVTVNPKEVTMLTSSTLIIGNDDTYSNLTVSVTNQYGEEVTDATWTAELRETSSEGVITSISYDTNTITINTGTVTGTGVITISVAGTDLTATIAVTVNQQYYDIDTITYSGGDVSLTYNLGTETVGSSTTISDEYVSYSSTQGPVAADTEADFALYSEDNTHISIEGKTITAVAPTEEDSPVTVYIYLVSGPTVNTTISVTVNDITDYAVTSLELVDTNSGNAVETTSIAVNYNGGNGSTTTSLSELGISVKISPDYAKDQSYTITSSNTDVITIDTGNNSITAHAVKEDTNVTLTVSATDTTYSASDTLEVTVTTDYVTAAHVSIDQTTLSKTEGDAAVQLTATVTGANGATATDQSVTWSSSNPSVATVSTSGLVSFVGAGSATIKATSTENNEVYGECHVTVAEAPKFESYTVSVKILTSGNTPLAPDETYTVYLQTDYDNWATDENAEAHLMSYDSTTGYYSYTFYSLPTGTPSDNSYTFNIYHAKNGSVAWNSAFGTLTDTITGSETGEVGVSGTINTSYADWSEVYPAHSGTTQFYIVLFENSNSDSSHTLVTNTTMIGGAADNNSYNYFGNSQTCSVTSGTTGSGQSYVYNSTVGTADADHRNGYWFTFYHGDWADQIHVDSAMSDIPDTAEGTYAVFCAIIDYNWSIWHAYNNISSLDNTTGWVTGVTSISNFLSSSVTGWVS